MGDVVEWIDVVGRVGMGAGVGSSGVVEWIGVVWVGMGVGVVE